MEIQSAIKWRTKCNQAIERSSIVKTGTFWSENRNVLPYPIENKHESKPGDKFLCHDSWTFGYSRFQVQKWENEAEDQLIVKKVKIKVWKVAEKMRRLTIKPTLPMKSIMDSRKINLK